ncbi:MAG: sulfotransferase [Pirellulales bacterium]
MDPLPDDLPELVQARALWARHDLYGAAAAFQQAVRRRPQHPRVLLEAAGALGELYQFAPAEALLTRLTRLAAGNGPLLNAAGQVYERLRRKAEAEDCFRQALAAPRPALEAHFGLAAALERRNELTAASEQLASLLAAMPAHAEGGVLSARVQRRLGDVDRAALELQTLLARNDLAPMLRARACAEQAALHDEQGNYAQAWRSMLAGKQALAPLAGPARAHRDRLAPALWRLAREVTSDQLARWQAAATSDPPPRVALLTGLPRSGTTLLERALNAHPAMVGCDEYDVFPRFVYPAILGATPPESIDAAHLDRLPETHLPEQRRRYALAIAAAVRAGSSTELLLDKNPSLLPLLAPYLRISPHARVLVALRDPRDVLVSCLLTDLPLNDFGVDLLDPRTAVGRVATDLECWLALRDKLAGNALEIRYEAVVSDLPAAARRAVEHLGLEWSNDVLRYREVGRDQVVHSPSYDGVAKPVTDRAIGRWRNYAEFLTPLLEPLAPVLAALGYSKG